MLAFKGTAAPVKYESNAFPAQFWFLFPFAGSRAGVKRIQLGSVLLDPTTPKSP